MTLMELLTVVMIIGILAGITIPSYRRYLMRANRTDATTTLLRIASAQEKHIMQYGTYVTATASMPNAHSAGGLGLGTTTERGFYNITLAATATGYTATARPVATLGQQADTDCRTLTINETGARTATNVGGTNTTGQCFR